MADHRRACADPWHDWHHEQLAPLPNRPPYDTNLITYRQRSRDGFVRYAGNFYAVPAASVQHQRCLRVTEGDDLFIMHPDGHQIAYHRISTGKNQRMVQAAHH